MIVYQHRRLDNNEIFYIGIGKSEKRAYCIYQRNNLWNKIYNKFGISVEIICYSDTWEEACQIEKYLIKYYGRRDLGLGNLVNFTDGGEGSVGYKHTKEALLKISNTHKGKKSTNKGVKLSEDIKNKMSESKKGKRFSEEHKQKISESRKNKYSGINSPFFGRKHTQEVKDKLSKKVLDITTNIIYNSAKEVSIIFNLKYSTLISNLNGGTKNNKTNFKYI